MGFEVNDQTTIHLGQNFVDSFVNELHGKGVFVKSLPHSQMEWLVENKQEMCGNSYSIWIVKSGCTFCSGYCAKNKKIKLKNNE